MRALLLIAIAACGKSSSKSEPAGSAAPITPVAIDASAGRDALVPLAYKAATDAEQATAGRALVQYASAECEPSPKAIYTAVVEHAGATLIGIDCHAEAAHVKIGRAHV